MRTLKLMADYHSHPLWEASPGVVGNVNPNDLPLSVGLRQALREWAEEYNDTLNISDPASSGFPTVEEEEQFKQNGSQLGERLRKELGVSFSVVVKL